MKLRYDREADVLTIEVSPEGTVDHAEHSGPFIARVSADGKLLLLEILDASDFLSSLIKVGLRGTEEEIPQLLS